MKELIEAIEVLLGDENKEQIDDDPMELPTCGGDINKLRAEISKITAPHMINIGHMTELYKACGGLEPMTAKSVDAVIKRVRVKRILDKHNVQVETNNSGEWEATKMDTDGLSSVQKHKTHDDAVLGLAEIMGWEL